MCGSGVANSEAGKESFFSSAVAEECGPESRSGFDFSQFVVFSISPIFTPKVIDEGSVEGFQVRGRRLNWVCFAALWLRS